MKRELKKHPTEQIIEQEGGGGCEGDREIDRERREREAETERGPSLKRSTAN